MNEIQAFVELTGMLFTEPRSVVLLSMLVTAAVIDVRSHRIPNWLTLSGTVFGLGYSAFVPFYMHHGFLWSLGGWALGFGLLYPLWLMRIMGAGDVKLMAMVGSLLGVASIPTAILGSFIAGGVLAIVFSLRQRKTRAMLGNVARVLHQGSIAMVSGISPRLALSGWESVGKMPFGLAIATGTIIPVVATQFGLI